MAEQSAAQLHALASTYDEYAHRFPVDHPAHAANLAEASKYHDLAERSRNWPETAQNDAAACICGSCGLTAAECRSTWKGCCSRCEGSHAHVPESSSSGSES